MAAATVVISESNTASETVTDGISNANFGTIDSPSLATGTYPITPGSNSYEKWLRLRVSAMGDATKIDNIKVYAPGASFPIGTGTYLKGNQNTGSWSAETFAAPVTATSTKATATYATSQPASANVGISGSLTGSLTAAGYSDYLVLQVLTNAADTTGSSLTLRFEWDEVA